MIDNEKELSVEENKENSHKKPKNIATNFKNWINEFLISRKLRKLNPYQTKQINSKNSFYVVEKKHYFNNEYAKRNISIVASTAFLILLGIYILFFSNEAKNTAQNSSYMDTENTANSQSDKTSANNVVLFSDPNLKKLVRDTLKIKTSEISQKDAKSLREITITQNSPVLSIKDLNKFDNLNKISIYKDVADLKLLPFNVTIKLVNLNFADFPIFNSILNISEYEGPLNFSVGTTNNGKFTFTDGSSYIGNFINGILKGDGVYTYPNTGSLTGMFNDIDFSGKAKLFYEENKVMFDGLFDGKYTLKGSFSNYFDGILNGTFYNKSGTPIFNGTYTGKNTLINNYFNGTLSGTYTSRNTIINGTITGKLPIDYYGNFNYTLNGSLVKNGDKKIDGSFNVTVENGKEVACSGNGKLKLPDEMGQNGLILEGQAATYNLYTKTFSVNGQSYRIINNSKVYADKSNEHQTTRPTPEVTPSQKAHKRIIPRLW